MDSGHVFLFGKNLLWEQSLLVAVVCYLTLFLHKLKRVFQYIRPRCVWVCVGRCVEVTQAIQTKKMGGTCCRYFNIDKVQKPPLC